MTEALRDIDRRFGFIAVLGAPNAGKSTLVNRLVGAKVSIVSPKPQTTRSRITGIAVAGEAQMAFLDTPGIFSPRRRLDRAMIDVAWQSAADADLIALVVDASRPVSRDTMAIIDGLRARRLSALLVLNKVDVVKPPQLLVIAEELNRTGVFSDTFMISAATGDGVDDLKRDIAGRLPKGPWHFPEDELSDLPARLLAAEITREQVFVQLRQEVPYGAAVETEAWEEFADGSVKVSQVIHVQRAAHKAIVLGEGGSRIKALGAAARGELAKLLGRKVHLMLHVRVDERWAENRDFYRLWGLEYEA